MGSKVGKASLSKGRSSWCVIFRHPTVLAADGVEKLRVRRGLGTSDKAQAQQLVEQLNALLADESMWNRASRERAEVKYDRKIVAAFFDAMQPDPTEPWKIRDEAIPLPGGKGAADGYARVLFIGTTGAGKTTLVRQLLGTDPETERFPSISAAKTTTCDLEIVLRQGKYKAIVTFLSREMVRQLISECVTSAVATSLEKSPEREVVRRFLEHSEQKFRLSYVLGNPMQLRAPGGVEESDDEGDDESAQIPQVDPIPVEERAQLLKTLEQFLSDIKKLAELMSADVRAAAKELGISLEQASRQEKDTILEIVEDQLVERAEFHELVDCILDEVESKFDGVSSERLVRGRDEWPLSWNFQSDDRQEFIRAVNRFSSNYAPQFGRLLTPMVEGIRIAGPFGPEWLGKEVPRLVLMDGQGIGHIADSSSSISTSVTRRFSLADSIVLVDNAAQPMQAGPFASLQSLVASGHESKLIVAFTHFDEVRGDNLAGTGARKDHILGSFDNAIRAIGKAFGHDAEVALKRLVPERVIFLAKIQEKLSEKAKLSRSELSRLVDLAQASAEPAAPIESRPVYDVANLVLAIQKATQEFHARWNGILGLGAGSTTAKEHWTRVKALSRRLGIFSTDEYDTLKPVADLIRLLQIQMSVFIAAPLDWTPRVPADEDASRQAALDSIKKEVFDRLHALSRRRVLEDQIAAWVIAFEYRGVGSTPLRAKEIAAIYDKAAPVPNEVPERDANDFLFAVRELVAESVLAGGGHLRGWSRKK